MGDADNNATRDLCCVITGIYLDLGRKNPVFTENPSFYKNFCPDARKART
jgi:hypothetical protein